MAVFNVPLASGYVLRFSVWESKADAAGNFSVTNRDLRIIKGTGTGKFADGPHGWTTDINGVIRTGTIPSYDFRGYSELLLDAGTDVIAHGPDGIGTLDVAAAFDDNNTWGELGDGQTNHHDVALTPIPRTPTGLTVTRVSDSQQALAWTRVSGSDAIVVQRRSGGGPWVEIGRPGWNAAEFADTTTAGNGKYEYQVAAVLNGMQSAWSSIAGPVYTSPAAPSSVTASRSGDDIKVTASGLPPYATSYDVDDNGTIVASGVSVPWTHVTPNASVAHRYRVRGVVAGIPGVWSGWSNTVQLIAPPNAPTGLTPNGSVVPSDTAVRLAWVHNPVDASAQSAYEVQYRPVAGSWTLLSGTTATFRDVTLTAGDYEWQVRTKGADPSYGPWSAVASFTVITRPTVAINSPGPTLDATTLTTVWAYVQAQGRPQSAWEAELRDSGGLLLEGLAGGDASTQATFTRRIVNGEQLTVKARAATGGIWSEWAAQLVTASFTPPPVPTVSAYWDETLGGVPLAVAAGVGSPATTSLEVERSVDGGASWELVWLGAGPVTFTDWESLSNGTTTYRVTGYAATGAGASTTVAVSAASPALWLSGGRGYSRTVRLPYNPSVQVAAGRSRSLHQYERRNFPVAYAGSALARTVDVSGSVTASGSPDTAGVEAMVVVAQLPEPVHMFRDPDGRRIYGALSPITMPRQSTVVRASRLWGYSFTLTETGH